MSVSDSDLNALARKYRTLNGIRHGAIGAEQELLRSLSREFPGALRELDCVSDAGLEGRLADVLGATRGDALETWIAWMTAYHRLMRQVLMLRQYVLQAKAKHQDTTPAAVAARVEEELGEPCDPALVPEVLNPPAGRLNRLVFDLLGARFERSGDELEAVLFPLLEGQACPPTPHV